MKNLTTSIYTFESLITGDWFYVDKTEYHWELIKKPQGIYFLSRPRRFGKSLTLSTLKAIFQNKRHLFKGLALDTKPYDWKEYPVIHLDLGNCDSSDAESLKQYLIETVDAVAQTYDIELTRSGVSGRFTDLIVSLSKIGKVVILIDEYDKPILDNIIKENVESIREVLENFYSVIKATDAYQRFVLLTGVSKFSKVSVFSKLNNLEDLTMDYRCATMLGYTQRELEENFTEYIDKISDRQKIGKTELLGKIKSWYNGYKFHQTSETVYNPVSVGKFFESGGEFKNFWFATGTPSFLLKLVKAQKFDFEEELSKPVSELAFEAYEVGKLEARPLLFQTGYLTIKSSSKTKDRTRYILGFPNQEVEAAFEAYLIEEYSGAKKENVEIYAMDIAELLENGDIDSAMEKMKGFFANIPYDIQIANEKYYQSIFFIVFRLIGLFIEAEARTNKGRIDAVAKTDKYVYIIEFKLDGTTHEALAQIQDKMYYEKYLNSGREIILCGANFSTVERNISAWKTARISG